MSSSATKLLLTPAAKASIQKLQFEIFGSLPQLNLKTGYQSMKRMHRGAYIARYYPERLEKFAKMVSASDGIRRHCSLSQLYQLL
jgi:hypothetical protein